MAQAVQLTADALKQIFPRAPQKYIDGLMAQKAALDRAGITATRIRLAYALANVEHECNGFTIKDLTENINYSHERAAQVWPNRFNSAADVRARFGSDPGWQLKMFDVIYGNRMGNRPGTHDGSRHIGRGGPQITGRDGYAEIQTRTGITCLDKPELLAEPNNQAPILAAFWSWKNLNPLADAGNWTGTVRRWNGGTNGMADRNARMAGNDPVIKRLAFAEAAAPILRALPGGPTPNQPPQDVVDEATKKERAARTGGGISTGTGAAGEGAKAVTEQPAKTSPSVLSPMITYTLIAVGIVVIIVASILIAKKIKAVKANWV